MKYLKLLYNMFIFLNNDDFEVTLNMKNTYILSKKSLKRNYNRKLGKKKDKN